MRAVDPARLAFPLIDRPTGAAPSKARQLRVDECSVDHARALIRAWHSRLPVTQASPWKYAMRAHFDGITYAVALWNNPSARMLPAQWLELRRMAVAPDAPHCTASRFLGEMRKYLARVEPHAGVLLSYQDTAVHTGTIYRAAGWEPAYTSKPRVRDRSTTRPSGAMYRTNINGAAPDAAGKARWQCAVLAGAA